MKQILMKVLREHFVEITIDPLIARLQDKIYIRWIYSPNSINEHVTFTYAYIIINKLSSVRGVHI